MLVLVQHLVSAVFSVACIEVQLTAVRWASADWENAQREGWGINFLGGLDLLLSRRLPLSVSHLDIWRTWQLPCCSHTVGLLLGARTLYRATKFLPHNPRARGKIQDHKVVKKKTTLLDSTFPLWSRSPAVPQSLLET